MAPEASGLVDVLRAHYNKGFPTIDALYTELSSAEANAALAAQSEGDPAQHGGGGYLTPQQEATGPGDPPAQAPEQQPEQPTSPDQPQP